MIEQKNFEEWIDLTGIETERTYHFSDGFSYTVSNPSKLYVKKSGSHKLVDSEGLNHYIPGGVGGWKVFTFKGKYAFNVSAKATTPPQEQ